MPLKLTYVAQAGFRLIEICLLLHPEWVLGWKAFVPASPPFVLLLCLYRAAAHEGDDEIVRDPFALSLREDLGQQDSRIRSLTRRKWGGLHCICSEHKSKLFFFFFFWPCKFKCLWGREVRKMMPDLYTCGIYLGARKGPQCKCNLSFFGGNF